MGRQIRSLHILSEEEKVKIHHAALEVLERTGMDIFHEESIEILSSAGASVANKTRVRIPTFLVQEALNSAPSRVTIYNRDGAPYLYLCDDNFYFMASPGCLNIIDSQTQERRPITYEDVCHYAKIVDSLSDIEMIGSWMITLQPEIIADRYQAEAIISNTSKPFYLAPLSIEGLQDVISMCSIACGGIDVLSKKPFFVTAANPIPPLRIPELSCQKLLTIVEKGLPIIFNPMILVGATGPIDLYGSLILLIANNLAELVLSQRKKRGAPVILGGVGSAMDMRTGQMCYEGPELNLLCGALAEMGHFYGLPVWGTGGCSSSKILDAQAAADVSSSLIFSILTGANLIHDVGFLENGLTSSFEIQFLCNEMISMVRHLTKGLAVGNTVEALDLIDRIGVDGHYLTTPETFDRFRQIWTPGLTDRQTYSSWMESGGLSMQDRMHAKVEETLRNYHPKELDQGITKEMREIVEAAEKKYV